MTKNLIFRQHLFLMLISFVIACSKSDSKNSDEEVNLSHLSTPEQAAACREHIHSLGPEIKYDWILVPESDEPNAPSLKIFYTYDDVALAQNKMPLTWMNGGPGSDNHGTRKKFELPQLAGKFAVILMDQRGTGCSSPLPELYPKDPHTFARYQKYLSRQIMEDAELIRKKLLGEKKWVVIGHSFGGFILHRYLAAYPQYIEAAFAVSNLIQPEPALTGRDRIRAHRRILKDFLKEEPDIVALLARLNKDLGESDCLHVQSGKICGPRLLDAFGMYISFDSYHDYIRRTIRSWFVDDKLDRKKLMSDLEEAMADWWVSDKLAVLNILFNRIEAYVPDIAGERSLTDYYLEIFKSEKITLGSSEWLFGEEGSFHLGIDSPIATLADQVKVSVDPVNLRSSMQEVRSRKIPYYQYAGNADVFGPVECHDFVCAAATEAENIHFKIHPGGHFPFDEKSDFIQDLIKL